MATVKPQPVKPLFQAFTLADMPKAETSPLPPSRYNRVPLPTLPGYTPCLYEDRAWRANPKDPRDFSGFADWLKGLPYFASTLIDLEPLANAMDPRADAGLSVHNASRLEDVIAAFRTRPDVRVYTYGLPFTGWTPTTRGRTDALASAARELAIANCSLLGALGMQPLWQTLAGLAVCLYVPWGHDPNTPGLYWQRFIRRLAAWCKARGAPAIGCLCPTYVHTPEGTSAEDALLPLDRWKEAVAAVADEFDGAAVWYAPTAPYSIFRRHLETAAAVWADSITRNEPDAA